MSDPTKFLKTSSQRLSRIITQPFVTAGRKIKQKTNINNVTTKVMGDVRKGWQKLMKGKPASWKDYVAIGDYYVAKKVIIIAVILILVLPILYLKFLQPMLVANFFTKTMYINEPLALAYTGKVELLTARNDALIFKGRLEDGRINGQGTLYDYVGNLVYRGEFKMEMYEGAGESYYPNGQVQYKGSYKSNQYEGDGYLYREDGVLLYEGSFRQGQYSGLGKEYYANGRMRYIGEFA
ncbi:MAG: hypothetical protein Q4B48_06800, partial [Syntrophomonadaceae bacterium]|nr:hypothetical protein [Syntrophomonadaceae bacterium]